MIELLDAAVEHYAYAMELFKAWQAQGNDKGSTVGKLPADDDVIGWAKELLGF